MDKLKTLKDLEERTAGYEECVMIPKLRQEVIKWVKYWVRGRDLLVLNIQGSFVTLNKGDTRYPSDEDDRAIGKCEAFIKFFNITEKDLKCQN